MWMKGIFVSFLIAFVALSVSARPINCEEESPVQEPPLPVDDIPCEDVKAEQIVVPDDFFIVHTEGPTHAEWGADRSVSVWANGNYAVKENRWSRDEDKQITKTISKGKIKPEAVKRIYARVVGCQFFEMEQSYWNPDIRDGKRDFMQVTAQGRSHSVVTYYYIVPRFISIQSILFVEVPNASR